MTHNNLSLKAFFANTATTAESIPPLKPTTAPLRPVLNVSSFKKLTKNSSISLNLFDITATFLKKIW